MAADRMFTFPAPLNVEFQTPEQKIEQIGTSCVVLSAGNGAYSKEIIQACTDLLDPNTNPPISRAAEALRDAFIQIRATNVREQVIVAMLGPDYLKFERQNIPLTQYMQHQPGMFQQVVVQMQMFNLGTEMILAGVDDNGGRVAYLGHPGTIAWLDKLGLLQ